MSATIVNKNRKRQLAGFIDNNHSVMNEFYEITNKELSDAKMLKEMRRLIESDQDFYDPYLVISDILFLQDKDEEAQSIVKNAYERAVARISDAQGRWPRVMPWGFLENRHLMTGLTQHNKSSL